MSLYAIVQRLHRTVKCIQTEEAALKWGVGCAVLSTESWKLWCHFYKVWSVYWLFLDKWDKKKNSVKQFLKGVTRGKLFLGSYCLFSVSRTNQAKWEVGGGGGAEYSCFFCVLLGSFLGRFSASGIDGSYSCTQTIWREKSGQLKSEIDVSRVRVGFLMIVCALSRGFNWPWFLVPPCCSNSLCHDKWDHHVCIDIGRHLSKNPHTALCALTRYWHASVNNRASGPCGHQGGLGHFWVSTGAFPGERKSLHPLLLLIPHRSIIKEALGLKLKGEGVQRCLLNPQELYLVIFMNPVGVQ